MLRTGNKLQCLMKSQRYGLLNHHGSRIVGSRFVSAAAPDSEGEPSFLEMVNLFVENARELALQRMTTKAPLPGRRAVPPEQKRASVKGKLTQRPSCAYDKDRN